MNDYSYILDRNFNPDTFALGGTELLSRKEKEQIAKDTQHLRNLAAQCVEKDEELPDKNIINHIYLKFEANYKKDNLTEFFSTRELRHLIYSMHRIKEVGMMRRLLSLLNSAWRDRFFNGLLYYILSNFESARQEMLAEVLVFVQAKLKQYEGKRDKYLMLKKNSRYLQANGPELLGLTLQKQDGNLSNYCSLENASQTIFGMTHARLDFEYYSSAIVAYFEKSTPINTQLIEQVIKQHDYDATPKRLIPALIINEKQKISDIERDNIRTLAIHLIGDPALPSKWTFANGTREEKQHLEQAREIINQWITRKIINLFFEKCIDKPERKDFWIEHSELIRDFKIYCTEKTYASLKQDNRIADLVDSKTCIVMEKSSPLDPALGMLIGNYNIIEFSRNYALKIYQREEMNDINFLSELNINTLHAIQSFDMNYNEGKLSHDSGWEKTLTKWFENHGIL